MSRLIDADAFLKRNEVYADCEFNHPKYQDTLREIIEAEPSVDAVEVVRCKDCKKYIKDFSLDLCSLLHLTKGDDFYCADGERRSEDEK